MARSRGGDFEFLVSLKKQRRQDSHICLSIYWDEPCWLFHRLTCATAQRIEHLVQRTARPRIVLYRPDVIDGSDPFDSMENPPARGRALVFACAIDFSFDQNLRPVDPAA